MTDAPEGIRFSQNYMQQPELLRDSQRMRRRLGALIGSQHLGSIGRIAASELGIKYTYDLDQYATRWPEAVLAMDLRDCLDLVTIRFQNLKSDSYDEGGRAAAKMKAHFLAEARRIFSEERVGYRIDDKGGVHFLIDPAFEQSRVATVSGLGRARYNSAREQFDAGFAALDQNPPDGKEAIRHTFFAVEGLFRLMFQNAHQLSSGEVQKHLKPLVDARYDKKKPAIYVANKQLESLKNWIDAAHFYRHEPGTEEPAQPPIEIAVELVSLGAAWLRWLVSLDQG